MLPGGALTPGFLSQAPTPLLEAVCSFRGGEGLGMPLTLPGFWALLLFLQEEDYQGGDDLRQDCERVSAHPGVPHVEVARGWSSAAFSPPRGVEGRTGWPTSYCLSPSPGVEPSSPSSYHGSRRARASTPARPSQGDHVYPLGKAEHLGRWGRQQAQGHTADWWGRHHEALPPPLHLPRGAINE